LANGASHRGDEGECVNGGGGISCRERHTVRATIFNETPTDQCPPRITEVDILIDQFESHERREWIREQLENCFSNIWQGCITKVVFENEEVKG